jgi:predicted nucleic-acid-binding Zn-ribbon protein
MRNSTQCPKCKGEEILYVPQVQDSHKDRIGLNLQEGWWVESKLVGAFEAYICKACGFVELYVANVGELDLAEIPNARLLTKKPDGVYRRG